MKSKFKLYVALAVLTCAAILMIAVINSPLVSEASKKSILLTNNSSPSPSSSESDSLSSNSAKSLTSDKSAPDLTNSKAASVVSTPNSSLPVSLVGGSKVVYPGQFAEASVNYKGTVYHLTPNQIGNFERVNMDTNSTVKVQVAYPQAQVGDTVAVEVEDGGTLSSQAAKAAMSQVSRLDNQKTVNLQFSTTDNEGIYRVLLRNGADVKVLNFWAGALPK